MHKLAIGAAGALVMFIAAPAIAVAQSAAGDPAAASGSMQGAADAAAAG